MSEGPEHLSSTASRSLAGADLLRLAVDRLLDEDPVALPGPLALERLRAVLLCAERLHAAQLTAIRDMDQRELYALDAAGSARGWLRRQPGGEHGQVTLARRLDQRPLVAQAHAAARIATRAAERLCVALDAVPDELDDALLRAVLVDGIGGLLLQHTGGTPDTDDAAADAVHQQRAADLEALQDCCNEAGVPPARRLEPAFVLLAERLSDTDLGPALRLLLDPLQPDGTDPDSPAADPYYLELRTLLDGDVELRGHLDAETGQALAAEVERRLQARTPAARRADSAPAQEASGAEPDYVDTGGAAAAGAPITGPQDAVGLQDSAEPDPLTAWDAALARAGRRQDARTAATGTDPQTGPRDPFADRGPDAPVRLLPAGRRRHDALRDLLHDAAAVELQAAAPAAGPRPAHLTIIATLEAVEGRLGALPAQLQLPGGRPAVLSTATLQRLGCSSELDAVLLDAAGNPVGASSTRRLPNRRERRALVARWGPTCAIDGCPHTRTVPHHVVPWWLSGRTRLRDLVPLCESCHHDLHEGRRTLRLRDGRLIDDHGWAGSAAAAAA